jgi:hypothetical protein
MKERLEKLFLDRYAGRHFVAFKYDLVRDEARVADYASCFVLEVRGSWFLVTSGHWLNHPNSGLRHRLATGWTIRSPRLVDVFAGTSYPPLPMEFSIDAWAAFDDEPSGVDLAVMQIDPFTRRGLEGGGVIAISADWIQPLTFTPDSQVMLVGVPSESFQVEGEEGSMKFVMIPVSQYQGQDLPPRGCSVLAKLPDNPADPTHRVESVVGMSGCPVFKINTLEAATKKYWLVGIQSSWYQQARVVRITPVEVLVDALENAIERGIGERQRSGQADSGG